MPTKKGLSQFFKGLKNFFFFFKKIIRKAVILFKKVKHGLQKQQKLAAR